MLRPGDQIAGYVIERQLGRGAMGRVYEATDLTLERTVALKVLNDELAADPAFRIRFQREGRVQAALDHPHVVDVFAAGEADGHLYLAMKLVRGVTLKELLRVEPLDPERAVTLLTKVADALDTAHAAGALHRDVKPQNVLVDPDDHPYLADFGITKALTDSFSLTSTGLSLGTFAYISPEQVQGKEATEASDIYALASVLYEVVTGQVPFPRETKAAVLYAHVAADPPSASSQRPGLPPSLDAVIASGLAKDPKDRPPTAMDLMAAARDALNGAPMVAATTTSGGRGGAGAHVLSRPAQSSGRASLAAPDHLPAELADATVAPATDGRRRRLRHALRRPVGRAPGIAALVTAAAAGLAIGHAGEKGRPSPAPLAASASNGAVALRFPSTWARRASDGTSRVLGLRAPITLGTRGATLTIGTTEATTPQLLTRGALATLPAPLPHPDRVWLGTAQAYRYRSLRVRGVAGSTTVFAAPLDDRVLTASCTLTDRAPATAATDCMRILTGLRLEHGRAAALPPDRAYAATLRDALSSLDRDRKRARAQLAAAPGPVSQARAARAAAAAYGHATASVERAKPGAPERRLNAALAAGLRQARNAYTTLATASQHSDRHAYASAALAVERAEDSITAELKQLRASGYSVE